MHELAITESIVESVQERLGDVRVRRLNLEIGKLSGVVPDSVRFCFDVVAAGTNLEGAVLEIVEPAAKADCRACGRTFELDGWLPLCPCGSADVEVLGGRELRIESVEVC